MDKIMLGMRIRQARERKNLTSEQLAERIGLRPTSLDAIEKGSKVPQIDTFVAIVKALGVTCDELLVDFLDSSSFEGSENGQHI